MPRYVALTTARRSERQRRPHGIVAHPATMGRVAQGSLDPSEQKALQRDCASAYDGSRRKGARHLSSSHRECTAECNGSPGRCVKC